MVFIIVKILTRQNIRTISSFVFFYIGKIIKIKKKTFKFGNKHIPKYCSKCFLYNQYKNEKKEEHENKELRKDKRKEIG